MTGAAQRRSIGGGMVEQSLAAAGFELDRPDIALVETRVPRRRPFDVVVSQSAWNVMPRHDFVRMSRPYPPSMRRRMWARRTVAAVNLRRARRVLCLTQANADEVRRAIGREAEVAPVWLPLDFLDLQPTTTSEHHALVPGTVTWFKNPSAALEIASRRGITEVLFAGRDDGSGCWQNLSAHAARTGVAVSRSLLTRQQMCDAMASASVVILPSTLETLGFSLCEALILTPRVIASPLPSHREVAARLPVAPVWMPDAGATWPHSDGPRCDAAEVRASWQALGVTLGLEGRR